MHSLAYDKDAHHHHHEDTHCHHYDEQPLEAVVATEDIAFGTYDADAPSHALEWCIEDVGVVAAGDVLAAHRHHAALAAGHKFTHIAYLGKIAFESLGEDCLTPDDRRVGMNEIHSAAPEGDGVGVGVGLHVVDNLRQPLLVDVERHHAHEVAVLIVDRHRIGAYLLDLQLARLGVFIHVVVGVGPIGRVEQFGYLIPVHVVVVVGFAALLFHLYLAVFPAGIDGEVVSAVFEMLGFECQRASREHGVVLHNHACIDIH